MVPRLLGKNSLGAGCASGARAERIAMSKGAFKYPCDSKNTESQSKHQSGSPSGDDKGCRGGEGFQALASTQHIVGTQ